MRTAVVALSDNEVPAMAAGRYIRVTVKDQGVGIPPENLNKIFDPYFSTKGRGRGQGLGLSVCRSIMIKHGGFISAESRPGAGAVFTLHFPEAAALVPKIERPTITAGGGRVLVMDDEAPVAKTLTRMLEHLGYRAESVADGQAAIGAYEDALKAGEPFDAVIMDLTVADGWGGRETISPLLALDPKAKVLVSSGYSDDPVMSEYAAAGFAGVLAKPYTIEKISAALSPIIAS